MDNPNSTLLLLSKLPGLLLIVCPLSTHPQLLGVGASALRRVLALCAARAQHGGQPAAGLLPCCCAALRKLQARVRARQRARRAAAGGGARLLRGRTTARPCTSPVVHCHLTSPYLVGRARRYVVVMPRWPAAGLGHLVRVVMLAYKSVDDTLPVCKARPPPPPRARSSRAAAPPGAGFWWGANGGRALGMRGAAARAAPHGPPVRSRARQGVAEQAGSWGSVPEAACEAKDCQGLREPGAGRKDACALLTGCTAHRMHCSQDALLTGCTAHRARAPDNRARPAGLAGRRGRAAGGRLARPQRRAVRAGARAPRQRASRGGRARARVARLACCVGPDACTSSGMRAVLARTPAQGARSSGAAGVRASPVQISPILALIRGVGARRRCTARTRR